MKLLTECKLNNSGTRLEPEVCNFITSCMQACIHTRGQNHVRDFQDEGVRVVELTADHISCVVSLCGTGCSTERYTTHR